MATSISQHAELYRMLRSNLRKDMCFAGIPNPVAGQILNFFDPANEEYLAHVDAWVKTLCAHWNDGSIPFVPRGTLWNIHPSDSPLVPMAHQVAKLVYKWHGEPAKKTDWAEVASRLSHPYQLALTDVEVKGIRRILRRIQPPDLNEVAGRFGPGATAEGYDELGKWLRKGSIPDVPANLYRCNPHDLWAPSSYSTLRVTKMAEVPKSIKANRTVSSEPAMSMYAQLAIGDNLIEQMHRIFPGHVSLRDQSLHNRYLHFPDMCTADLSDASDHVRCDLVQAVLPQLWPVLATVRSEASVSPNQFIWLTTFAPMGSGVCFPVLTLVIIGLLAYAYQQCGGDYRTGHWSVYGDDSIFERFVADYFCDLLARAGLVLNEAKSCFTGDFVESCGLELYHGRDITPAYIRDPLSRLSADTLNSIATRLESRGFWYSARQILDISHPVSGWKWDADLQKWLILVPVEVARQKMRRLDGYAGLNRWFALHTRQTYEGAYPEVNVATWTKLASRYRDANLYPSLATWALDMCPPK